MAAFLHGLLLVAHRLAADDDAGADVGGPAQVIELAGDLRGQLTCRCEHQRLATHVRVGHRQDGQAERGGLARAGLRLADHVFAGDNRRDQRGLDAGGVFEPGGGQAFDDLLGEPEVGESGGLVKEFVFAVLFEFGGLAHVGVGSSYVSHASTEHKFPGAGEPCDMWFRVERRGQRGVAGNQQLDSRF